MFFSSFKKISRPVLVSGFTLFEMIVVIAIFTIVTGIILAGLPSFRSKTALDLKAQEVALQIRATQLYAMNTMVGNTAGTPDTNIFGYALDFPTTTAADPSTFSLKKVTSSFPVSGPLTAPVIENISTESYFLGNGFKFSEYGPCNPNCSTWPINYLLRLYFKRPKGEFYYNLYNGFNWTNLNNYKIRIKISPKTGSSCRYVEITPSGQISVNSICP